MKVLKRIKLKLQLIQELFSFLWKQKLYWLIPMITILVLFGLFFILAEATTIAHFVYPLI